MKKFVRTLDFYGYEESNNFAKESDKLFPISEVGEIKNRKYVFGKKEEEDEENNEENPESGDTQTIEG
jgi:hypothetical protein